MTGGDTGKSGLGGFRPSQELIAITERWMKALESRDGPAMTALFSGSEALRYIGTDRNELFRGDLLRKGYAQHVGELPEYRTICEEVEAFARKDVGWATWIGEVHFLKRDQRTPYRFSLVFELEAGIWKIVHVHVSNPRSNVEVWGGEHQLFQQLLQAAKAEGHDFGVEGTATIMFTDIANSTSLAAFVGDKAWAKAIARHFLNVREIVEDNDGTMVKTLGDGTMSSFTSARAGLHAACAIQNTVDAAAESKFRIRIGLHAGDVIQSDGDFYGSVVNKAARIASVAEPGTILVSEATKALVGKDDGLRWGPLQSVRLRGIEGEQLVARLLP